MSWRFNGNELKYLQEVLETNMKSSAVGTMTQRLEDAFAKRFGIKYAVASNSGTSTLHQALVAFGVEPGDEVLVPAMSVIMCASTVIQAHAIPVFVDCDQQTFLMDPIDVERKITNRTKAIMPVHLCGQVCDMQKIMHIAKQRGLLVLEDCAQCVLGQDDLGRLGGTIGDVGSFSFENSKHLSTGEGGILITNNVLFAERMRKFGSMGYRNLSAGSSSAWNNPWIFQDPNYVRHDSIGHNYRMSELVAAVGLAQVERIDELVERRRWAAEKFLEAIGDCTWIKPQYVPIGFISSYWTFAFLYGGCEKFGVTWYQFRDQFIKMGGEKIRSQNAPIYREPGLIHLSATGSYVFDGNSRNSDLHIGFMKKNHPCPVVERIQLKMMLLSTNQGSEEEIDIQATALRRTIEYFQNQTGV